MGSMSCWQKQLDFCASVSLLESSGSCKRFVVASPCRKGISAWLRPKWQCLTLCYWFMMTAATSTSIASKERRPGGLLFANLGPLYIISFHCSRSPGFCSCSFDCATSDELCHRPFSHGNSHRCILPRNLPPRIATSCSSVGRNQDIGL